jgi:hypothetical protein
MSKVIGEHKTKKGTLLPLLNLRGKKYLEVAYRIQWFEEENPNYTVNFQYPVLDMEKGVAVCNAIITIQDDDGIKRQVLGTKCEHKSDFNDFIEKAQTGAFGRALAYLGYGTQFTGEELNEGARIADAPTHTSLVGDKTPNIPKSKNGFDKNKRSKTPKTSEGIDL